MKIPEQKNLCPLNQTFAVARRSLNVLFALTFLHVERFDAFVDGPETDAGGLVGLGHFVDDLSGEMALTLIKETSVKRS